ncbi:MAG: Monoamine oxidase [uncultured Thermomicrobiales bacterium]|uniref:Amine oxidase n=1 Tax=uncultured Thermomicrobiales bacterium TaxID=1645740 RepID=A0A6J4VJH8_9BACT|nr:MAG: Monoamine oxidase [uncultured Thermomicrobiales bacterium]
MALAATRTRHPLEPLSVDELAEAVAVLRSGSPAGPWDGRRFRFVDVALREPSKAELLAFDASGGEGELPREARAVLIDRGERTSVEAVVSLNEGRVTAWETVAAGQAPFTLEEILACEEVVRRHPDFRTAMKKRGIADMDLVWVDPWPFGVYEDEADLAHRRLTRGLVWVRSGPDDDNGYAHPVDNVVVVFDLHQMEVVRVEDHGVVPVPAANGNYGPDDTGPARAGLRPIAITQPEGPSFEVDGTLVRWQNWRLRVGFTPREGLVLHTVGWEEGGRVRPVLHRAAMSEMVVPYGDPSPTHGRKNTYDGGELNFGALVNSLTLGCDCLGEIRYFDAALVDQDGTPFKVENAICMHEEDYGTLWRHQNMRTGRTDVRRSRRLVVSSFSTIGNYDYGIFWYLYQDGGIQCEVKLTGILSTGAVAPGETPRHGQLLNADGLYAPIHQHFFNFRLDLDVDGSSNTVWEEHAEAEPAGPGNPLGSAFRTVRTPLRRESEAQQLVDPLRGRVWRVVNPGRLNAVGEPVGYRLVPHGNVAALAGADASITRRAAFMTKHLWVTPHDDRERHAAGDFPAQHPGAGLPDWTAGDRPIEDRDVVLWYTLGSHHAPRPEDWPVMPVAYAGFLLQPAGFFDRNPALDVPAPTPHGDGHCCP